MGTKLKQAPFLIMKEKTFVLPISYLIILISIYLNLAEIICETEEEQACGRWKGLSGTILIWCINLRFSGVLELHFILPLIQFKARHINNKNKSKIRKKTKQQQDWFTNTYYTGICKGAFQVYYFFS